MSNMNVDIFPSNIVMVPVDHPKALEDLNPSSRLEDALHLNTTRVVIMQGHLMIASDMPEGPQVIFSEDVQMDTLVSDSTGGRVVTASGKRLAWVKDTACGCGSRLRSWRPYKHLGSSTNPGV